MENVGPFKLDIDPLQDSYQALARSILHQQITGKAAQAIMLKALKAFADRDPKRDRTGLGFAHADEVLAVDIDFLRTCGLSRNKALAIKDLAQKQLDGEIPSVDDLQEMDDEKIIEILTRVRGIGAWTVHMLLIFRLGRLDILPYSDYGVRKGYEVTYGKMPSEKELCKLAEKWRPYRSIASWYMWRALEQIKVKY